MDHRRVVVTGMGAVTPFGLGIDVLIDRWCSGESAVVDGAAPCTAYQPLDYFRKRDAKRCDRFSQFAIVAAREAMAMAGWEDGGLPYPSERIGCVVGTGSGGQETIDATTHSYVNGGPSMVSAFFVPMAMDNAPASLIALNHGLQGPSYAVASACASGNDAIADAVRMLRLGEVDAMITGGAEAPIYGLPLAGFRNMDALSELGIPRPFDARRDGFVMGEGAGILILEEAEAAERRGAPIHGEILGFGVTNDAFHMVAPSPEGRGALKAMQVAIADSGVSKEDVVYINAHGTGTAQNDRSETEALKNLFGERANQVPVSSLKSAIGHLIGAAGAVESIATVLALKRMVAPPTLNYGVPDDGLDLDYVPNTSRPLSANGTRRPVALNNAFGFGGHNSVLVWASAPQS